jgi:hypothetical protein
LASLATRPRILSWNLVLPTGVQPAKSSVESAVPLAPGDGRLVRAVGIEPNTSCLEDRHAAHYATPARMESQQWTRRRRRSIRPALSVLQDPNRARWDRPPGSRDGGEYRDRTCASRRTRRVSTALPYRSANSPIRMVIPATCAVHRGGACSIRLSYGTAQFRLSYTSAGKIVEGYHTQTSIRRDRVILGPIDE